ncbi:hypothetical protein, partial [Limnospira sp. PMC 289.06]
HLSTSQLSNSHLSTLGLPPPVTSHLSTLGLPPPVTCQLSDFPRPSTCQLHHLPLTPTAASAKIDFFTLLYA